MAESTRGGLKPGPNGELPLDIPTETILRSPELRWMLMPMPKKSHSVAHSDVTSKKTQKQPEPKRNRDDASQKQKQDAIHLKRMKRTPMPKQLVGCVPCNDKGTPFCFGYNLGTCKESDDCKKGLHRCCKKGCGQKHPFVVAHKAGA